MSESIESIKLKIAEFALDEDKREVGFYPEEPSKWWPESVIDPKSNVPFTCQGAWEFIADELRKKQTVIEDILLDKPLGKLAHWFVINTEQGGVYIKVRLTERRIIGRSFHLEGAD